MDKIRIGTRGSALALFQANAVKDELKKFYPAIDIEIKPIKTTGDNILDRNLAEIGGKGLFIKEIEEALLAGDADIAVHSMKDVTAFLADGLEIACMLKREDARDAFLSLKYKNIEDLPDGAIIGTSSPRRAAQLLAIKPNVQIVPFRGNLQTRIAKLKNGEVDATFLAIAGLNRLNLADSNIVTPIAEDKMLPAVGQGAIGIEICSKNTELRQILQKLNHHETFTCVAMEREFLKILDGSCRTPIAALAKYDNGKINFSAMVASTDGRNIRKMQKNVIEEDALREGKKAGQQI